jgi:5-methyltetrahydrofolate--homocysteine methyltransferase
MTTHSFVERLRAGEVLVADGATGTNHQLDGLRPGIPPEEWVLDEPDKVLQLHQAFVKAGADIILTNSFGGTRLRMRGSAYEARAPEVNRRAARLAREAAASRPDVLVAGSMGPTGSLLRPLGPLERDEVVETYAEQAQALTEGGVDFLLLETMFAIEEATPAIQGARQGSDLPLVCTFSYDRGLFTMMGVRPDQMVAALRPHCLAAMGANCGTTLEAMEQVVSAILAADPGAPVWAKPNAGLPVGGTLLPTYTIGPEDMAAFAVRAVQAGARVVGGCCGNTPAHVAAMARAVHVLARKPAHG